MDPTRLALEAGLRDCPDDTAAHAAYADYLAEQGDPRGDYIRLQLASEDRGQPPARLRAMEQEAVRLLRHHERDWLGPLYPFVLPDRTGLSVAEPVGPRVDVQYRRGWVHRVQIRGLTAEIGAAVAACPLAGMLAELDVGPSDDGGDLVNDELSTWPITPFSPTLTKLTVSGVYCARPLWDEADPEWLDRLLRSSKRLEYLGVSGRLLDIGGIMAAVNHDVVSLSLTSHDVASRSFDPFGRRVFPRLQTLSIDIARGLNVPTPWAGAAVAGFASALPALQYLATRFSGFSDAGVEVLLASGVVDRLTGLDLSRCQITDDGARMLAAHPAVPRLEYLRLADNYLSPMGIADLAAVGVTVSEQQLFGPPPGVGDDGAAY